MTARQARRCQTCGQRLPVRRRLRCAHCRRIFATTAVNARYCSTRCRVAAARRRAREGAEAREA